MLTGKNWGETVDAQFRILEALVRHEGIGVRELVQRSRASSRTVQKHLGDWITIGLVETRGRKLYVKETGRAKLGELRALKNKARGFERFYRDGQIQYSEVFYQTSGEVTRILEVKANNPFTSSIYELVNQEYGRGGEPDRTLRSSMPQGTRFIYSESQVRSGAGEGTLRRPAWKADRES